MIVALIIDQVLLFPLTPPLPPAIAAPPPLLFLDWVQNKKLTTMKAFHVNFWHTSVLGELRGVESISAVCQAQKWLLRAQNLRNPRWLPR